MSTKLVVSIDGLLLSNFNTVVANRSIDEVILVGTSSQFNEISSANRESVITKRGSNSSNFTLSVAFPNSTSTESIDDDFYNWLQENSISFFYDPSLESLSSSLVLTSSTDDDLGTIEGKFVKPAEIGSNVKLLLQPEDLIHDDKSNLKFDVVDRKFRGTNFIYTLRTEKGNLIPVFVHSHHIHQHDIDEKFGIKKPVYIDHLVCF